MLNLLCRLTLALCVALVSRAAVGQTNHTEEAWYVLEMGGARAGYAHTVRTRDEDRITSRQTMKFKIKRGELTIPIDIESEFIETSGFAPISMKSTMAIGAAPIVTETAFLADKLSIITRQNGAETRSEQPLPEGTWLTPAAAEQYIMKRLAGGETELVVRMIDATTGPRPLVYTRRILERTTVEALGKTVPAVKWASTVDIMPTVESIEFVDENGTPIRSEVNMGGIAIVTILADKDLALAELSPPELLISTLVKPDKPIENARTCRAAMYTVSVKSGTLPDLPTTGSQVFTRIDDRSGRIDVNLDKPAVAPETEVNDPAYLADSAMINTKDPDISSLVARALENIGPSQRDRAEALRRFVSSYIQKKTLGVGFATASEVADTRAGDCSEHGVLLSAMLRAAGIRSRVATGVLYVDEFEGQSSIFGFHMWAQALLEDEQNPGRWHWVDFDGVLPNQWSTDATHIALAVDALNDQNPANGMVALAPLIGSLEISVNSVNAKE